MAMNTYMTFLMKSADNGNNYTDMCISRITRTS